MKIIDLMPPCFRDDCPIAPNEPPGHKHILESQTELINARERMVLSAGGYGSGKSVAAAVKCYLMSAMVPGNRGIVLRRTYPKLHETAQREFNNILKRANVECKEFERRGLWANHLVLPNGSEIFFRPSKDLGRFLGPEYGWAWIDEAIEEPEDVIMRLLGRLRLPVAGKNIQLLLTTNPPGMNHWITRMFGPEPGSKSVTVPVLGREVVIKTRRIGSATIDNPALPDEYVATLQAKLPPSEVARVLYGKTGFSYEGKPVFGGVFSYQKHVGEPELVRDSDGLVRSMYRGWDFGYHAPAIGWHQITKCWHGRVHWLVMDEFIGNDIEYDKLAEYVMTQSRSRFSNVPEWVDIGDAAGAAINDRGPGPIIRLAQPPWNLRFRYKKFPSVDTGIRLLRKLLAEPVCRCGKPTIVFHRRCTTHIDAFAGGYHYPKEKFDREMSEKPVKDGMYDNPADEMRYVAELGFQRLALSTSELDQHIAYKPPKERWIMHNRPDSFIAV